MGCRSKSPRSSHSKIFFEMKYSQETTGAESLFNKVAGLKDWIIVIKRLQHRFFPVNIAKFLIIAFL